FLNPGSQVSQSSVFPETVTQFGFELAKTHLASLVLGMNVLSVHLAHPPVLLRWRQLLPPAGVNLVLIGCFPQSQSEELAEKSTGFGDWANKKIHKNSFCGGCAGSRKPVDFSANSSDWLCGKHPIKTKFTPAGGSNCLQRSNTGGCAKCTDNTFIPSTSDAKCVLASSKPNCVTVSGNTDDCDTCDPGFKK
ncbi:MAG: hypothetical protein AAFP79_17565, partial [Pseudomonadota bacterium]